MHGRSQSRKFGGGGGGGGLIDLDRRIDRWLTTLSRSKFTGGLQYRNVFNLWYRAYYNINVYPIINNMLDQNFGYALVEVC